MPGDYEKQGGDDESCGGSCVSTLIFVISMILIICTFPFSLCVCIKMVQVRNQYLSRYCKYILLPISLSYYVLGVRKSCYI